MFNRVVTICQMFKWISAQRTEEFPPPVVAPISYIDTSSNPADLLTKQHSLVFDLVGMNSYWQKGYPWMSQPTDRLPAVGRSQIRLDAQEAYIASVECRPIHPNPPLLQSSATVLALNPEAAVFVPKVHVVCASQKEFPFDLIRWEFQASIRIMTYLIKWPRQFKHRKLHTRDPDPDSA